MVELEGTDFMSPNSPSLLVGLLKSKGVSVVTLVNIVMWP